MARFASVVLASSALSLGCFYDWEPRAGGGGGAGSVGASGASAIGSGGAAAAGGAAGDGSASTSSSGPGPGGCSADNPCAGGSYCDVQGCDPAETGICTASSWSWPCRVGVQVVCTCGGWFPHPCFAESDGRDTVPKSSCAPPPPGYFGCGNGACKGTDERCVLSLGARPFDDQLGCEAKTKPPAVGCKQIGSGDTASEYWFCKL